MTGKKKITWVSLLAGLVLVSALAGFIGCAGKITSFDELVGEGDEVRVYRVFGMDCPGCHGGLEKLINKVPGVKGSKANWEKQELKVVIRAGAEVTDADIFEAVKQANFTAGERVK